MHLTNVSEGIETKYLVFLSTFSRQGDRTADSGVAFSSI